MFTLVINDDNVTAVETKQNKQLKNPGFDTFAKCKFTFDAFLHHVNNFLINTPVIAYLPNWFLMRPI